MDLKTLMAWMHGHVQQLKTARDEGQSSTELALIAGALLLVAALVVAAIKTKVTEKIGIINGG